MLTIPVPDPSGTPFLWMLVMLPSATDIRPPNSAGGADKVEMPAGSGRFYQVQFVDDIGKGFPNEHRFAILAQMGVWPTPIP